MKKFRWVAYFLFSSEALIAFVAFVFMMSFTYGYPDFLQAFSALAYSLLSIVSLIDYEVIRRERILHERWVPPSWAKYLEYVVLLSFFALGMSVAILAIYLIRELSPVELLMMIAFGLGIAVYAIFGIRKLRRFDWFKLTGVRKQDRSWGHRKAKDNGGTGVGPC